MRLATSTSFRMEPWNSSKNCSMRTVSNGQTPTRTGLFTGLPLSSKWKLIMPCYLIKRWIIFPTLFISLVRTWWISVFLKCRFGMEWIISTFCPKLSSYLKNCLFCSRKWHVHRGLPILSSLTIAPKERESQWQRKWTLFWANYRSTLLSLWATMLTIPSSSIISNSISEFMLLCLVSIHYAFTFIIKV